MGDFTVITRVGTVHSVEGRDGVPLMEIIRDAGFCELAAMCGGCLSCATCHVYVEGHEVVEFPEMCCDEDDLLDGSDHRKPRSRLSCQIPFRAALAGITVTIAPED